MTRYEYKVIPAPQKGQRGKGVKGPEGKFANAIQTLMNQMGADGWQYQRAETLPSEERAGLTSKTVTYRHLLIFRRPATSDAAEFEPTLLDPPVTNAEDDTPDQTGHDQLSPEPDSTETPAEDHDDDTRL